MDLGATVKAMQGAGFSLGEAVIIALVVAQMVRLKLRTDALARDRMRMWAAWMDKVLEIHRRIDEHEEKSHGNQPTAEPS